MDDELNVLPTSSLIKFIEPVRGLHKAVRGLHKPRLLVGGRFVEGC